MRQARPTALLIWAAGLAGAAWVILRAHYTADLSAFLPRTPTAAEQMLVDQLREGVASRLILVGIEGDGADERARVSLDVGRALRASALFSSVHNGEPIGVERDR